MDLNHLINADIDEFFKPGEYRKQFHLQNRNVAQQEYGDRSDVSRLRDPSAAPCIPLKLPIPRLRNSTPYLSRRISCACSSCRASKVKCTGEMPRCKRCALLQHDCQYPEKKSIETERYLTQPPWFSRSNTPHSSNRKLEQVSGEAHDYKTVLQQLRNKVTVEDAETISAVLAKVCSL